MILTYIKTIFSCFNLFQIWHTCRGYIRAQVFTKFGEILRKFEWVILQKLICCHSYQINYWSFGLEIFLDTNILLKVNRFEQFWKLIDWQAVIWVDVICFTKNFTILFNKLVSIKTLFPISFKFTSQIALIISCIAIKFGAIPSKYGWDMRERTIKRPGWKRCEIKRGGQGLLLLMEGPITIITMGHTSHLFLQQLFHYDRHILKLSLSLSMVVFRTIRVFFPYAYGLSHTRIPVWETHTHTGNASKINLSCRIGKGTGTSYICCHCIDLYGSYN